MDWRLKAIGHWAVSLAPDRLEFGYRLQRHVTHTLPIPDGFLEDHVTVANEHLGHARRYLGHDPDHVYEFGAGWDLVVPLALARAGVTRQTVTDVNALMRPELVADAAARIGVEGDLAALGIRYLAPVDSGATGLPSASFDLASSTDTLEHVPKGQLHRLLAECRRLLRSGAVLSVRIDYRDHYSYADPDLGPFNFLRYDRRAWRRWNPPSHYQSRLRHSDMLGAIEAAGFRIVEVRHPEPAVALLPDLADQFRHHAREDLAVPEAWIIGLAG